jgi:hypothetical protein
MKLIYIILIISCIILNSCSTVRESAGVNRKNIDEFVVIENPPLIIPPDFNLISPDKLEEKKIDNSENELAREILFGLEQENKVNKKQLSTMNQILSNAKALDSNSSIREEIDENFAREIDTDKIFQINLENEIEVLDAIKESERIRNNTFEDLPITEGELPIKKQVIKTKKKKRFILF